MQAWRRKWQSLPRGMVVLITALVIYVPLSFIVIQSFLSAPFFSPSKVFSLEAFEFIFTDPDFYKALKSGFILAFGLVIISIPLGGMLAFLMVRTDLPGRAVDRAADPGADLRVADGAGLRLRGGRRAGGLLLAVGGGADGLRAVEHLLDCPALW